MSKVHNCFRGTPARYDLPSYKEINSSKLYIEGREADWRDEKGSLKNGREWAFIASGDTKTTKHRESNIPPQL